MKDWYRLTQKVSSHHLISHIQDMLQIDPKLHNIYNGSPMRLLSTIFPEHNWLPWKFTKCPKRFWDDLQNQRKFMDWAAQELKINDMSDWYNVTRQNFADIGGITLLSNKYNYSPSLLLSTVYPDYNWLPWRFQMSPRNFLDDLNNHRKIMDWAAQELKIKDMSDWYKVTVRDLSNAGCGGVLSKYKNSPAQLLATVYPEYDWLPWKFVNTPRNIWQNKKNIRMFFDWVGKQLGVQNPNDWERVSIKDIQNLGGSALLYLHNFSLSQLLQEVYPEYNLTFQTTGYQYKKSQYLLKNMIKTIFPQEEALEEYKHPDLITSAGYPLELDLFYPKLNIAVEYQGRQHFARSKRFTKSNLQEDHQRDIQKNILCKEKGITLIEVPYWWDRKYESLAATIYNHRPELFIEKPVGQPIPYSPPTTETKQNSTIKSTLMTATEWDYESMDPSGWYMTEKYDGMRFYWNGSDFYTRQGNKVKVPEYLKSKMPKVALDGELWTKYGLHQEAVSMCKTNTNEEKWKEVSFWVFDAPNIANKPYEERVQMLEDLKNQGQLPSFVNIIEAVKCESREHLKQYFDSIVAKGGEGVMLREPGSEYKAGRSTSLRKYKPFFDTEVKVVENNYPHGFDCLQMDGKSIFVGLSDNYEEAKKIKPGNVITVKHGGVNVYGKLQYPKFYRKRTDVKWEDLIKT